MAKRATMRIGPWQIVPDANRITDAQQSVELEPRVMDLLMLLAEAPGEVFSKADIVARLWGDLYVNDDALTRCVFKLRKALQDDARNPQYVETVSKRGYRLIAPITVDAPIQAQPSTPPPRFMQQPTVLALGAIGFLVVVLLYALPRPDPSSADPYANWLARADGFYSQYTQSDNEAALKLYQSVLDNDPNNAAALAGYSNTLTQRLIRYQGLADGAPVRSSLTQALESGWLQSAVAKRGISRAISLAQQATTTAPSHARAWRALGLAHAADADYKAAEAAYERALVIEPDDWGTMINLSELYSLAGQPAKSLPYLTQAWFAMENRFADDPVSIRTWHSAVGLAVAEAQFQAQDFEQSKLWYRRVRARDPLNLEAARGLVRSLQVLGEDDAAKQICAEFSDREGPRC